MHTYLNTKDAADYLGIKERKLYELVANGAVPCSKVTGKWLFPQAALDRWVEAGLAHPDGFTPLAPPPIIGGSHDPLLEWAARRSGSGLALLSVGSETGLAKLTVNEIAIAAIHIHQATGETGEDANLVAVGRDHRLHDGVVIAFARREQGLLLAPNSARGISSLSDVIAAGARFGRRQSGAGSESLLQRLLYRIGKTSDDLLSVAEPFATGDDLAFAIRAGVADCGVASRAVAVSKGLAFVPLAWERFDLAMRRRTYFELGPQKLFALMRDPEFRRHAELLTGYDVSEVGDIRFNR